MYGWNGKILSVDLSNAKIKTVTLDARTVRDYVGGRGLGIHCLSKEVDPQCEPLSAGNALIMMTGPLTGTKAPTASRYMVTTKSPLTGAITCSNSGGLFPAALKKAGWDGIIFHGRAAMPVYLWINGEDVQLRSADHLWGKTTHETHAAVLRETSRRANVSCIGPAGELLVRFAAIMNDKDRAAGRSGVGAVMGYKNLKAVAVWGRGQVPIWDTQAFNTICDRYYQVFRQALKKHPNPLRLYGTAMVMGITQTCGILPTRNFQKGSFEGWTKINAETLREKYLVKRKACFSCPIACGRYTRVTVPRYSGEGEGPEYETLYALGSNCNVDNLDAILKANYLCNEFGCDTITMGATIACAMELGERGLLKEQDVGRKLRFGDAEAMVEMTKMACLRQGFGDDLAEGSLRLATKYGQSDLSMHSKGQEFAGYDPRGEQGMGLAYATSPIGASHMRGDPAYSELFGVPFKSDPLSWEGKGELVSKHQDFSAVVDSAGLCIFYAIRNLAAPSDDDIVPEGILELLNAATGADYSMSELRLAARRIINAERQFLVRAGFSRADDTLPPRMVKNPLPEGPAKGRVVHLGEMVDEYYAIRGWDADGKPTASTLREVGL